MPAPTVDIAKLVQWNPSPLGARYVAASGDKRAGQSGTVLGTIALRHASGYEVVMQMDHTGKIETFAPNGLFPLPARHEPVEVS
ncbi:MAG: hypothetical protein ACRER5_03025 [Pseudomonas sp.]